MTDISRSKLVRYLETLHRAPVAVHGIARLGEPLEDADLKGYGYGSPLRVEYETCGKRRSAVLETVSPGPFGHEDMSDRAQTLLWDHRAWNALPKHVRSIDVGGFREGGDLVSLGNVDELFVLMEFADGAPYADDLRRLRERGDLQDLDVARCLVLVDYLVEIHARRGPDPGLYVRRIRDLVGHGECIFGLADSYPAKHGFIDSALLERIEKKCVEWRWRLRSRTARLRQVHGDFHPWNLLFREGTDFTVLDRARGEWGEPADDVTSLAMNYFFFSLQRSGRLEGGFETLWRRSWDRYLEKTGDVELLEVAAPFFAFRGLVMASPLWYPKLDEGVRRKLFSFIENVLDAPRFEPARANAYAGA
ncbi:MAG TPA: phosphotransferase [Planctomycetota bacterium]|nr:phosphotransferase [Planctomycetota bacterium]